MACLWPLREVVLLGVPTCSGCEESRSRCSPAFPSAGLGTMLQNGGPLAFSTHAEFLTTGWLVRHA